MFDDPRAIYLTFGLYILLMLLLGLLAWRRTRDLSDYLLGGRRLGRWVTALSAEASDMSGWLLLGLPGYAYAAGYEAGWIALGLLAGTWLNWRFLAQRLRQQTFAAGDALTLPAFLAHRFPAQALPLRLVAAGFILLFFTFYTGSGLVAGGRLFETVFAWDYRLAVLVAALVVVLYTFLGGFLAVSWTDVVQGLLMCAALLLVPAFALSQQGGWTAAETAMQRLDPQLLDPWRGLDGEPLGLVAILSLLGWGLGYFGQPHILARFMAARDGAELHAARRIAMAWVGLTLGGALLVGWSAIGFLETPLSGADTERVFMQLVAALFHPLVAGVLLAAILAAVMSTADSQLLVASSALANDFYQAFLRRQATPGELVRVGRLAVLLVAGVAVGLALNPDNKVLDLVAYAWAGFGAAFGPTLILTLYWRGMRPAGALAGIVVGGLTVILWRPLAGGWFDLYEIIPGILASTLAILLFSRSWERRP
ncbi:sodium/proline symporter PutP [Thiohalobacter sp. IOR34]|uniref:sodium/proline symporter PutP n=1 Tax=Thiohalobacter sp. IOR34 TaxID=3057176 RepID=UPI0025AFD140|nr:sodium/proline symporter PutP [Thiohalobacter sp. IOR34]WJW76016.1 sodium/proline symporter PutP [Thiohalobacter sp. IOR34]